MELKVEIILGDMDGVRQSICHMWSQRWGWRHSRRGQRATGTQGAVILLSAVIRPCDLLRHTQALLYHAQRLLALHEGDLPYVVSFDACIRACVRACVDVCMAI